MAESAIVAAVQLKWKRYEQEEALRGDLERFIRLARNKQADVVLLPELTGLMLTGPLAVEKRRELRRKGGILDRILGGTPELADVLPALITEHSALLAERYVALFGGLAKEFHVHLVAGTLLAADDGGRVVPRAGVFGSDGALVGWQPKLHLTTDEGTIAEAGDRLELFEAPFGKFGVLVGHDILFPELARALAYRGAIGIFNPTLARSADAWHRQRLVLAARAVENQIFVAQSFFVGTNDIFVGDDGDFVGRSAVLAPVEVSGRGDGILAQIGAEKVEGVVTGEWNVAALRNLWASSDVPVRDMARGALFHDLLAFDYRSGVTIAERTEQLAPAPARDALPAPEAESAPEAGDAIEPTPEADVEPEEPHGAEPSLESAPASMADEETEPLPAPDEPPADASSDTLVPKGMPDVEPDATDPDYEPIIDPESGEYLGERRVDPDDPEGEPQ